MRGPHFSVDPQETCRMPVATLVARPPGDEDPDRQRGRSVVTVWMRTTLPRTRRWPRIALAIGALATLALLLYTIGAPHIG
jgi:hypothetical protein